MRESPPTLINGHSQSLWSVQDRGLQYGDGLFETLNCIDGQPRWFARHLKRLAVGCERLGLPGPDGELLLREVRSLLAGAPRALVKIIYTRGVASARGYRPSGNETPTRIVSRYEWSAPQTGEFRLGRTQVPLAITPHLAGLKHLNRLEQVLAQRDAASGGWQEVVMANTAGAVISGSMSNLFVVRGEEWLTAPLAECGVAGVMRSLVLELAAAQGITVQVGPLSFADLDQAAAMFVTNVRWGLQPVHWYHGRRLAVDERGARLQEGIDATVA